MLCRKRLTCIMFCVYFFLFKQVQRKSTSGQSSRTLISNKMFTFDVVKTNNVLYRSQLNKDLLNIFHKEHISVYLIFPIFLRISGYFEIYTMHYFHKKTDTEYMA